jgi:hypothetical protein
MEKRPSSGLIQIRVQVALRPGGHNAAGAKRGLDPRFAGTIVEAGFIPIIAQIRMRHCKEKHRHSGESRNPVVLILSVKSIGKELDPGLRQADGIMVAAV